MIPTGKGHLVNEVCITEGSTLQGAGLYDVEGVRYGVVKSSGEPVWRPSADVDQWSALIGPAAEGWVFSGEMGRWSTDQPASAPVVWPESAGRPQDFVPEGVQVQSLAEYQVLLAPRRGTFMALGMFPDGRHRLWAVVDAQIVDTQELGEGYPQWHPSAEGFTGALVLAGTMSPAFAMRWCAHAWSIDSAEAHGTVVGAIVCGPEHLLVSTFKESEGGRVEHSLFARDGSAVSVQSALPVINGAVIEGPHLLLAANSVNPVSGVQTHVEFHSTASADPSWSITVPGELFLAAAPGQDAALLYSATDLATVDGHGKVVHHTSSGPEPRGISPDGLLIRLTGTRLEPVSTPQHS